MSTIAFTVFPQFFAGCDSLFSNTITLFVIFNISTILSVILEDSCLTDSSYIFIIPTRWLTFSLWTQYSWQGRRYKWSIGNHNWYWTSCVAWSRWRLPRNICFCSVSANLLYPVYKRSEAWTLLKLLLKFSSIDTNKNKGRMSLITRNDNSKNNVFIEN